MSEPICFRYRTSVLVGLWRRSPAEAIEDAIVAQQAFRDRDGEVHWAVGGKIEKSLRDEGGSRAAIRRASP